MDILTTILALFLKSVFPLSIPCNASIFGWEGDDLRGGEAICLHRELGPNDMGIAHRFLPCGALVKLENPRTGKTVITKVIDRGPYGAMYRGRWIVKRKKTDRGQWRGCVDMTKRTARMLGHNGFEPIFISVVNKKDAPVVQWQNATLTWWRRWFDSIQEYHKKS